MKRFYKIVMKTLPHISIILALSFLVFTILDWFNPLMGFTTNTLSSRLMIVYCVTTILSSLRSIAR